MGTPREVKRRSSSTRGEFADNTTYWSWRLRYRTASTSAAPTRIRLPRGRICVRRGEPRRGTERDDCEEGTDHVNHRKQTHSTPEDAKVDANGLNWSEVSLPTRRAS